jgi:hypothetical protein
VTEAQRTSNGTTHWSVGSPPDPTTVTQDRRRFTSHEDESSLTTARNFYTTQGFCFILSNTNLYKHYSKLQVYQVVFRVSSENNNATTYVAEVGTILSPKHGVTSKGHCRPGTDPIPRTSQAEQCRAKSDYPLRSRTTYLKTILLARLNILILSKAYPIFGYT